MGESSIEWTDATWNPVRGCTKITPGCDHCYAATFAERWRGTPGHAYEQGFDLRLVPHKLVEPLRWSRPRMVFVNSMSDLFQKHVQDDYVRQVWDVMASADWHGFQVLTKRASRMRQLVDDLQHRKPRHAETQISVVGTQIRSVLDHIWLGVSVENRKHGIPRIEHLRQTPAAIRFLSIEPLLEDLGEIDLTGIDWVIVGGESGPGARLMRPEWVTSIKLQCDELGVHFFFKQWGGVRKKKTGRELAGQTWDAMPELHCAPYPGHRAAKERRVALSLETGQTGRRSLAVLGGSR